MTEQAGIYRIDLFENKGIALRFADSNNDSYALSVIGTSGKTFNLDFCNYVKVSQDIQLNANLQQAFNYSIEFSLFDLTPESRNEFKNVYSRFGYYALIYFKGGFKKFINVPMLFNSFEQNLGTAHQRFLILASEQPTINDFYDIKEAVVFAADSNNLFLADENIYFLTE